MGTELSPEYWRVRAEQIHAMADATQHPDTREMLMRIADDYERNARVAEQIRQMAKRRSA